MNIARKTIGNLGEEAAVKYLKEKDYVILDRNFQNNSGRRLGEIDIVARGRKENELVFVEVKTREMAGYGDTLPEENITYPKLRRLEKIAQTYIRLKKLEDLPYRFDAISVWLNLEKNITRIKHIESL
ncbi:MAG: YraN family protein [Candidatus Pacebacteria bacterium]|nr:YraN family protein [Candidatus Paceibacterota bacterium]MDR3583648.1 YraN family protein [Candidatus Paceibacterota bacterium]